MKKILVLFLSLLLLLFASSCNDEVIECGVGEDFNVTLNDPDGYIINEVQGMKMSGSTYKINSLRSDIIIEINGTPIAENPQAVKDSEGEILYYSWSFTMPREDIVISVLRWAVPPSEAPVHNLSFVIDESAKELFIDTYSGEYAEGDKITIEPISGVLDACIVLKANGVRLEEAEFNKWEFTMPHFDVTIVAFTVVDKMDDEYSYLNIEDTEEYLSKIADGYYKQGTTVFLYSDYLLSIVDENGNKLDFFRQDLDDGDAEYKFIYSFVMPSADITLKIGQKQ